METYANTFLLGKNLTNLYFPVRKKDSARELVALELRQQYISKEILCLQQELSYLSSIAAAGTSTEGTATDAALAQGVTKARNLAAYQLEHGENAQLINDLSGRTDNSERLQQKKRIDSLIREGVIANERFAKEINKFAEGYFERQNVSITVSHIPDANNPEILNYTVIIEEAKQQPSPLRIPKAITLLLSCIGLVLSCVWVLWKHHKPNGSTYSSTNG